MTLAQEKEAAEAAFQTVAILFPEYPESKTQIDVADFDDAVQKALAVRGVHCFRLGQREVTGRGEPEIWRPLIYLGTVVSRRTALALAKTFPIAAGNEKFRRTLIDGGEGFRYVLQDLHGMFDYVKEGRNPLVGAIVYDPDPNKKVVLLNTTHHTRLKQMIAHHPYVPPQFG
jgi:hypothetical protein